MMVSSNSHGNTNTNTNTNSNSATKNAKMVPLPPSITSVTKLIVDSCSPLFTPPTNSTVYINESAIDNLITSTSNQDAFNSSFTIDSAILKAAGQIRTPLKFDTIDAEFNFVSLLGLLSFGSSYTQHLPQNSQSVQDIIKFGLIGAHLSDTHITSKMMSELSLGDVATMFNIPLNRDVPHPTLPGVYIGEHTALRPFAQLVTNVLNETGLMLLQSGSYSSFGQFVLRMLTEAKGSVNVFIESIVKAVPSLRDMDSIATDANTQQDVYLLTKAQKLAFMLYMTFGSQRPELFSANYLDDLTALADEDLVNAVLRLKLVEIKDAELSEMLKNGQDLSTKSGSLLLRAAAVMVVERLKEKLDLGMVHAASIGLGEQLKTIKGNEGDVIVNVVLGKDSVFV